MQEELLKFLSCPVCKKKLLLHTIQANRKKFKTFDRANIETGTLSCPCGFVFPIIDFVPRMLLESFIDHEKFLLQNIPDFMGVKAELLQKYGDLISAAQKRNKQTKESFSLEWSLIRGEQQVNVWHLTEEEYKMQLFHELDLPPEFFKNKLTIDVGCGHG